MGPHTDGTFAQTRYPDKTPVGDGLDRPGAGSTKTSENTAKNPIDIFVG